MHLAYTEAGRVRFSYGLPILRGLFVQWTGCDATNVTITVRFRYGLPVWTVRSTDRTTRFERVYRGSNPLRSTKFIGVWLNWYSTWLLPRQCASTLQVRILLLQPICYLQVPLVQRYFLIERPQGCNTVRIRGL